MSAVLVSRPQTKNNTTATFSLGCTRQWLAADFAGEPRNRSVDGSWSCQTLNRCSEAHQFAYRGSVGPLTIPKSVQLQIDRAANLLAQEFSMRGVWGMDFMLDADDQVWPVDFNPRITASAELFESRIARSNSKYRSVLDLHLSACHPIQESDQEELKKLADDRSAALSVEDCESKRIVFFTGPNAVVIDQTQWEQLSSYHVPGFFQNNQIGASIADVPRLGDRIEAGRPLLTIRSRAKTETAALALLDELFKAVQTCVGEVS